MAAADWVRMAHEYDGNRRGRSLRRPGVDGTRGNDDIDFEPDQFLRKFAHPFWLPLLSPILDRDGPTLRVTQVAKSLSKRFDGIRKHGRTATHNTDAPYFSVPLNKSAERRCERTGTQSDYQFAAIVHFHFWLTDHCARLRQGQQTVGFLPVEGYCHRQPAAYERRNRPLADLLRANSRLGYTRQSDR